MKITRRPTASLASESFDRETLALLDELEVEFPEFGDVDLDVAFGTPLDLYEAGTLAHEQLDGLDIYTAIEAIEARENRLAAARDIVADPAVTALVRERLVDVLLPYASQLNPANTEVSAFRGTVTVAPLAA
ncbi:hypothetical protein [Streptomyces sp. HUAS TT20]|uniref:hypothetical protein n=1 Tax=Streptomyces sp. HUAS TT20 TaxID=3447509 RepID=UPI0021D97346|nr:hypothetical protein [Streptomyces sp. HUAS 15-9]UXY33223.1 hypothetical protein N8I87_43740 [Streptomyces sp. HUAS 15-9]